MYWRLQVTRNATAEHEGRWPVLAGQRYEPGHGEDPSAVDESSIFACTRDPERWTTTADEGAKALCRACPRRWECAQQACRTPGAEGLWAGILIPAAGRGRQFALRQLRSMAEHHGFSVRTTTRSA
jgi:WhiB family redox-sensing transcriptional regulator